MQWEILQSSMSHESYRLWHNDKQLLTLTVNEAAHTARVECKDEKRVFLIRKEGFLKNKTMIRNEYGVRVGEIGFENKENFIELNDERYLYTIEDSDLPRLIIYKETPSQPFVICGLSREDGNPSVQLAREKVLQATKHPGLLMALCWYMFLPVAKEPAA